MYIKKLLCVKIMGDNETPTESWNMATATLKRLSGILDQCSFYSQRGEMVLWFNALLDLRRNMYAFMDEKEFIEVENKLKSLPKGWTIGNKCHPKLYPQVHRILDECYMIFIKSMKSKGLLMPKMTDVNRAVLDM